MIDHALEKKFAYPAINVTSLTTANGVSGDGGEKLYTTPEDMMEVHRRLNGLTAARFLLASTFGNVHGVYKPGQVKLRPSILKEGQEAVEKAFGKRARFALVFHGGSGSTLEEIREAVDYGVVKMNIDTDTQYAFTRPLVGHMMKNYDSVLKIEGNVGNKEKYDPRSYMKLGGAANSPMCRFPWQPRSERRWTRRDGFGTA